MPYINEKALSNQIKSKEFSNVYFLFGKELYILDYLLKSMIKNIVYKSMEGFNLQKFNGEKFNFEEFETAIEALPVMSEKKCVVVNDINFEKMSAGDTKKLKEILDNPPPFTIIIFYITGFEINLKKSPKLKKITDIISKVGDVVEFSPKSTTYLIKIIQKTAEKNNCTIDKTIANLLIQRVGNNINDILINLDKICCYVNSGEIIKDNIMDLTVPTIENTAFDFSKAILKNNFDLAYNLLNQLFYQRIQPIVILGAINMCFIDLYKSKLGMLSGKTYNEVAKDFNYKGKEFRIKNAYYEANKFSIQHIRKCLKILMDSDIILKSSKIDGNIVLEEIVGKMIVALGEGM